MEKDKQNLFSSINKPVPPVRRDLDIFPVKNNRHNLLYFHDSLDYVQNGFALDRTVAPLLSLLNGKLSILQIAKTLQLETDSDEILGFVQLLDENLLLETPYYEETSNRIEENFETAKNREPALLGISYPNQPVQFSEFVNSRLNLSSSENTNTVPQKALFAPHIDIDVGKKLYSEAFSSIKSIKPKRVVILATSHYAGYYGRHYEKTPFIGSSKNYKVPGKLFKTDTEYLDQLTGTNAPNGFTFSDRAHRVEHSIEIHLMYLSAIWNHDYQIVPILIAGFDELFYYQTGELAEQISNFTGQLRKFHNEDTFYLISGDLSHVGKKFGDQQPAEEIREYVESSDQEFLSITKNGAPEALLNHVKKDYDSTRICGFPPLYTFLRTFPGSQGKVLNYHWWDETERESAVSFGAIAY